MKKSSHYGMLCLVLVICVFPYIVKGYSCPVSNPPQIQLGGGAVVCIHFVYKDAATNTSTNDTYDIVKTYAFNTTVDKFSALRVSGLGSNFSSSGVQIHAVVQFQNNNTVATNILYSPFIEKGISRTIFSFVVNIENGQFIKITKDNANCDNCQTSNNQVCSANTDNFQCFDRGKYPASSDPKFYISWIGTDKSGNHMLSHTKRLSRFSQYSIGSIYQKAKSLVS